MWSSISRRQELVGALEQHAHAVVLPRLRLESESLGIPGQHRRDARQQADHDDEDVVLQADVKVEHVPVMVDLGEHHPDQDRDEHERRHHHQNVGPRLHTLGEAVVAVALPPEIGELAMNPEAPGDGVTHGIDPAQVTLRLIQPLERPQADLHPGKLVRLLDRIGVGDDADRVDVGVLPPRRIRLGIEIARADPEQLPIDRDPQRLG